MSIDARLRRTLHDRFEQLLGVEEAMALMEHLAPDRGDLARTADLDELGGALRKELQQLGTELRGELQQLGTELRGEMQHLGTELRGGMQQLGTELRGEMQQLSTELRGEVQQLGTELRGELAAQSERFRADLHREVGVALAHQTQVFAIQSRTMVLAVVGAVVANGGLAFAAARLGG